MMANGFCTYEYGCISGEHQYKVSCDECDYHRPDQRCKQCLNCERRCGEEMWQECVARNFVHFRVDTRPISEWVRIYVCTNCGNQVCTPTTECAQCHAVMRNG